MPISQNKEFQNRNDSSSTNLQKISKNNKNQQKQNSNDENRKHDALNTNDDQQLQNDEEVEHKSDEDEEKMGEILISEQTPNPRTSILLDPYEDRSRFPPNLRARIPKHQFQPPQQREEEQSEDQEQEQPQKSFKQILEQDPATLTKMELQRLTNRQLFRRTKSVKIKIPKETPDDYFKILRNPLSFTTGFNEKIKNIPINQIIRHQLSKNMLLLNIYFHINTMLPENDAFTALIPNTKPDDVEITEPNSEEQEPLAGVAVRGLPVNARVKDIQALFDKASDIQIESKNIKQLTRKRITEQGKLVYIKLRTWKIIAPKSIAEKIIDKRRFWFGYTMIIAEKWRGEIKRVRLPIRCGKCQRLGHTNRACRSQITRCRYCDKNHFYKKCRSHQDPNFRSFCCNCNVYGHTVMDPLCPDWQKAKEKVQRIRFKKSKTNAWQRRPHQNPHPIVAPIQHPPQLNQNEHQHQQEQERQQKEQEQQQKLREQQQKLDQQENCIQQLQDQIESLKNAVHTLTQLIETHIPQMMSDQLQQITNSIQSKRSGNPNSRTQSPNKRQKISSFPDIAPRSNQTSRYLRDRRKQSQNINGPQSKQPTNQNKSRSRSRSRSPARKSSNGGQPPPNQQ